MLISICNNVQQMIRCSFPPIGNHLKCHITWQPRYADTNYKPFESKQKQDAYLCLLTIILLLSITTCSRNASQEQCLGDKKHVNVSLSYTSGFSSGYKHRSETRYKNRPDSLWTFLTVIITCLGIGLQGTGFYIYYLIYFLQYVATRIKLRETTDKAFLSTPRSLTEIQNK
jgi:hypothetical protein